MNPVGSKLIQIQKDRFIHNWRKVGEGDKYPRYEPIRDTFRFELEAFRTVLAREQFGHLLIKQSVDVAQAKPGRE